MTYSQRNSHRNAKKWGHVLGFKISDTISAFFGYSGFFLVPDWNPN